MAVYAPGSVSNLGPGFDCLGLAFTGRGDLVTAHRTDARGVRVAAVSDPRIPKDAERNTAAIAAAAVWSRVAADGGLELTIEKGLPLAAGMGGSAASAVAGAVAADAVLGVSPGADGPPGGGPGGGGRGLRPSSGQRRPLAPGWRRA